VAIDQNVQSAEPETERINMHETDEMLIEHLSVYLTRPLLLLVTCILMSVRVHFDVDVLV